MKISAALLTAVSAEWTQPNYWEVFDAVQQRSGVSWGFPVGVRAAAEWSNCEALTVPDGAASISCDGSTCATICMPGYQSKGQRRTRCRWNKTKGFFWKRELGACFTCDPATPVVADSNVTLVCAVTPTKNRQVCIGRCPDGGNFPGGRKNKLMKAKCKCPKKTGVCGWIFKRTTATSFDAVTCEGVTPAEPVTTAAVDPVTTAAAAATTAAAGATTAAAGATTAPAGATTAAAAATTAAATTAAATTAAGTFSIAACEAALASNAQATEICAAIDLANTHRVTHQVEPFGIPDSTLCDGAQAWAQDNADNTAMAHSTSEQRPGLGENLASGSALSMSQAQQLWQDEDALWDFSISGDCTGSLAVECPKCTTGTPSDCWHFTQNVWSTTTHVCFGKALGGDGNWYIAARYSPGGNFLGSFDANVLAAA